MFVYSPQRGWAYGINKDSCSVSVAYRGSRVIMERAQDFDSGVSSSDPSIYCLLAVPGIMLTKINVVFMKPVHRGHSSSY